MTVGKLKEILGRYPDNMGVLVTVSSRRDGKILI